MGVLAVAGALPPRVGGGEVEEGVDRWGGRWVWWVWDERDGEMVVVW